MKIKFVILLITFTISLIILSACQREDEQIYENFVKNSDDPTSTVTDSTLNDVTQNVKNIDENISGELTIYAHSSYNIFDYTLINEFNKEYPNVHVNVIGKDNIINEEYQTKATVALMSGTAGDIMELFLLPYFDYVQNGLLENLYPYMENDPTFRMEDYYTNIFETLEYKDQLYGMPLGFRYNCYRFNETILKNNQIDISQMNTVNYKNIFDIYHQISNSDKNVILSRMMSRMDIETDEYSSYFNQKSNKVNFDSAEFISYLNEMKNISWPDTDSQQIYYDNYRIALQDNELCSRFISAYNDPRNAKVFNSQIMTEVLPSSASNGDKPFWLGTSPLAITSASQNKELAWMFLRFCIEERTIEDLELGNTYFIDGYPINRNNTLKQLEKAFGADNKEAINKIDIWNSERNCTDIRSANNDLLYAVSKITDEFYADRVTAEECAEQIQERVEIYLKE